MTSYDQEKPIATGFPMEAPMVPWSTGLCDCFDDCSNCCLTCWCPCITFGQTSEIVDRGLSSCGVNGALYALIGVFTGCSWIYSCTYRTKFRRTYNLEGSDCKDCLIHFWCESCALCQQYRELKNRGYDVSLGCTTCWCPCFTFGQTSEIVDRGTSSCGQNGALYVAVAVVFGCPCIYSCAYRTKLRQTYNIDGSPCCDFMTHWCCNGCALCQEYRELRNQGFNVDLGWHGNMERHNGVAATAPPTLHGGMNR